MSAFDRKSTAEDVSAGIDLAGKHAIVTGANTGIGFETARALARCGCRVTLACRNLQKAADAKQEIERALPDIADDALQVVELDLASFDSIRKFATEFLGTGQPIHLLINNAGVMLSERSETRDGFEIHLGVNHLGHFLLTNLLLDRIRESAPARVVVVSSSALHFAAMSREFEDMNWSRRKYSGMRAYGNSKLMNALFTNELTHRLEGSGVVANALHPGIVATELGRSQAWYMKILGLAMLPVMKSPERGAATTVMLATQPEFASRGAGFYSDCQLAKRLHPFSGNRDIEQRLWRWSEELTR